MSPEERHGLLSVRTAALSDLDLVVGLSIETFRRAYESTSVPEDLDLYVAHHFDRSRIERDLACERTWFGLASENDAVVGYVRLDEKPAPPMVPPGTPVSLSRLYLMPEAYGRGIGDFLMESAITEAVRRRGTSLWLTSWSENHRALKFYRRWGFVEAGIMDFEFGTQIAHDPILVRVL